MKLFSKMMVVALTVLLLSSLTFSQVKFDFENSAEGTQNWGIWWGNAGTALAQAADPSGRSTGVLKLSCTAATGDGKAAIGVDPLPLGWTAADAQGAKFFTIDIFVPEGFPDSAVVKLWAQIAEGSWAWTDYKWSIAGEGNHFKAGQWVTLHYPVLAMMEANAGFEPWLKIKGGVEIYFPSDLSSSPTWAGDVLIDNFALVGVEPVVVTDFTANNGNFGKYWGDALLSVAVEDDPAVAGNKVFALNCDAAQGDTKAAIGTDPVNMLWTSAEGVGAYFATFKVWVPADFPTNAVLKVWMQIAEGSWQWTDYKFSIASEGERIKAGQWNTIHYPIKRAMETWAGFQPWLKVKGGIEIFFGAGQTWAGKVLMDDYSLHTLEVGDKWIVANWEKASAGTQNFVNSNWGAGLVGVAQGADPSGRTTGVLVTNWDFSKALSGSKKGSFDNANINLGWPSKTDTGATAITMDVWVPADAPLGAQISIFAMDHTTWTWTEKSFFLSDSTFKPGTWNKMTYDVLNYVGTGEIDPTAVLTVGCQIYYNVDNDWAGTIYFDNFTLLGVKAPEGKVASPAIAGEIGTFSASGTVFNYFNITWEDNEIGTETYNVYMSTAPINNTTDPGVILIGDKIPHGTQYYAYRPWSGESVPVTYYFAVAASDAEGTEMELTDKSRVGPLTTNTSVTAKAFFVENFASVFSLDGLDNEFADYKQFGLKAERHNGTDTTGWTAASPDMSWNATFIIDADYLYISADVTDDDLNASGSEPIVSGSQAWMGDALEFYIGFYNAVIEPPHLYKDVDLAGTGDWRMSFTAWGTTQKSGSSDFEFPGVERTVYQKFTGDGYIIEVRIALDSLAKGGNIDIVNGAMLPLRIDGTDLDPSKGDTERSLWTGWGNTGNSEDWKRPATFGFLQVVGGPTAVETEAQQPLVFELKNNYPNPFNPVTTINYQVARSTQVRIAVYDLLGKEVATLVDGRMAAGAHVITWNGRNNAGQSVSSGVYFCRMVSPEYTHILKMTLLK